MHASILFLVYKKIWTIKKSYSKKEVSLSTYETKYFKKYFSVLFKKYSK